MELPLKSSLSIDLRSPATVLTFTFASVFRSSESSEQVLGDTHGCHDQINVREIRSYGHIDPNHCQSCHMSDVLPSHPLVV